MQPRFNIKHEGNTQLYMRSYKNDYCLIQFHSPLELYFVDEGEMEIFVSGQTRVLGAGSLAIVLSYEAHAYKTAESSRSSVLIIPQYMCEELYTLLGGRRLKTPFITDPEITSRIKECYTALSDGGMSRVRQRGYLYIILGLIVETVGLGEEAEMPDTDLAARILHYIDENYKNGITAASISQHFGYNQSYLSRYFKSVFRITLTSYITAVKLRCAISLLGEGRRDITYCALESGFSSIRTFYRAFLSELGCSPKEYKRRIRE